MRRVRGWLASAARPGRCAVDGGWVMAPRPSAAEVRVPSGASAATPTPSATSWTNHAQVAGFATDARGEPPTGKRLPVPLRSRLARVSVTTGSCAGRSAARICGGERGAAGGPRGRRVRATRTASSRPGGPWRGRDDDRRAGAAASRPAARRSRPPRGSARCRAGPNAPGRMTDGPASGMTSPTRSWRRPVRAAPRPPAGRARPGEGGAGVGEERLAGRVSVHRRPSRVQQRRRARPSAPDLC